MTTQSENIQPERSAGRIIARNTLFGIGATFILKVANFIFTVLIVRTLGDEHFGQYSIVLAWAGLFSVIGDLGINQYLAREIARDKSTANRLFWDTVALRFILAAIASIITIGGAILVTDYPTEIIIGIALFTATYFFSALVAPLQSILTGNERVDVISVLNVISQLIFMALSALFLILGFDFLWLVIAGVINMPIIAALQFSIVRRNHLGPPRFKLNRDMWIYLIRAGLPFAAVQLSLSFAYQVDTIFLSRYTPHAVVGWYNAAYGLVLTLLNFSRSFNNAILPTLAREHVTNPDTVRRWYHTSVRFIMIIALPIAVGGSLLNRGLEIVYGSEFLPATIAFAILIWDIPFVIYHAFCGNIATSIRQEQGAARIYVSVGILNVILNATLIPHYGIIAACFATVFTDLFAAILFYRLLRKELGSGLGFGKLKWVGISAAIMGLGIFVLRDYNVIVVSAAGGLTYLGLIWLLPTMTPSERSQIIQLGGKLVRRIHLRAAQG